MKEERTAFQEVIDAFGEALHEQALMEQARERARVLIATMPDPPELTGVRLFYQELRAGASWTHAIRQGLGL